MSTSRGAPGGSSGGDAALPVRYRMRVYGGYLTGGAGEVSVCMPKLSGPCEVWPAYVLDIVQFLNALVWTSRSHTQMQ
jgi:hypothetical protein